MREAIKLYPGKTVGFIFVSFLTILLSVSCGKDINSSSAEATLTVRDPAKPEIRLDQYILSQSLTCEDLSECPDNVAKLIVKDDDEVKTCVGVLLAENKILTAASCLPRSLRIPSLDCTNDIFAIFPKTRNFEMEKISCHKILEVDENSYKEPALWKQDLAIFELYASTERRPMMTSQNGASALVNYETWSMKLVNENEAQLVKKNCDIIFNTYLNPYSVDGKSPMLVSRGCDFGGSDIGAPLIVDDEVVGIFSSHMDERMKNYLITSGLLINDIDSFYHFSNLACAQVSLTKDFFFKNNYSSCEIHPSVQGLDYKRSIMLRDKDIHNEAMKEYEIELSKIKKYFDWEFSIKRDVARNTYYAKPVEPKCIYKINSWIKEYRRGWSSIRTLGKVSIEYPVWTFQTKLDNNLKPASKVTQAENNFKFTAEFNPFEAYVNKKTYVKIISEYNGETVEDTYDDIGTSCK